MPPAETLPRRANGIVLRRLSLDDLATFQAYRNDPEVGRYQGWSPMPDADAAAFLSEMNACTLLEPGVWCQVAIADAASDALLGDIGLLVAADSAEAEVGFTVAPAAQGRGVATAAVGAAIAWLFASTAVARVVGITDARNVRSVRVLQRIGMQRVESRQAVFRGEACVEDVYAVTRTGAA